MQGSLTINNHYIGVCEYSHDEGGNLSHLSSQTGQRDLNKVVPESITIRGLDLSIYVGQVIDLLIVGDESLKERGALHRHGKEYQLTI